MKQVTLRVLKWCFTPKRNRELLEKEKEVERSLERWIHTIEDQLDSFRSDMRTLKAAVNFDRLSDIEEKLEEQDDRYHSAYARVAERRLETLENQVRLNYGREKELIERWKSHVADLQREVSELRDENRRLKESLNAHDQTHATAAED